MTLFFDATVTPCHRDANEQCARVRFRGNAELPANSAAPPARLTASGHSMQTVGALPSSAFPRFENHMKPLCRACRTMSGPLMALGVVIVTLRRRPPVREGGRR